jgi:geranylgeranyl pyrophosphate synthase
LFSFEVIEISKIFFSSEQLGKPAAADLELGLATAPVLFACTKFPELETMIARRFSVPGDVQAAFEAVLNSDGLDRTRALARWRSYEFLTKSCRTKSAENFFPQNILRKMEFYGEKV